tara:strand:- start:6 stop:3287 length:3282 start_codon:yes stop_codon:yes gene_type:complete
MSDTTYVSQLHANDDAKFFSDVYIYGNLYYDLEGTDNLKLDNITVNHQANFKDIFATGIGTFNGPITFNSGTLFAGIVTFTEPVDLDYLHVKKRLWVGVNDNGQTLSAYPEVYGNRVGINSTIPQDSATLDVGGSIIVSAGSSVGIGSTRPEQMLDIAGSLKLDRNIYDSINYPGANGYYLSRDLHGVRWVSPPPAPVEGVFVQNEGVNLGVGSFTTLNFHGTGSGGDLVDAQIDASNSNIANIYFTDNWVRNSSGIHTTGHVGIGGDADTNNELKVTGKLLVTDDADIDGDLNVDGKLQVDGTLDVDGNTELDGTLTVGDRTILNGRLDVAESTIISSDLIVTGFTTGTITTSIYSLTAGFATNATRSGFTTFADNAGISTFAAVAGFATNAHRAGFSTFADNAGFSTFSDLAGISTFAAVAGFATNAHRAGFATYADRAGISSFVENAGITTFVSTTLTGTNKDFYITFVDDAINTAVGTGQTLRVDAGIKYNAATNSVNIVGILTVGAATTIHGSLELDGALIDKNNSVAAGKTDYRLSSIGTGVSWRPPGVETNNAIWVTVDGNDANSGLLEGDAKRSIGGAAAIAEAGDTIIVRSGVYHEENPIGLRTDVAVSGEDLRLVTVVPNNDDKDVFHVRRGCLVQNLNFAGSTSGTLVTGAAVAFPPLTNAEKAVSGYIALGPANEGPRKGNPAFGGRYKSPYVRNCTNFMTGSIGMKIDGNHVSSNYTGTVNLGQDLKSMVCDSFTQYNEAGIGVSLTNRGYAQLVSIFTISCEKAIYADTGGQCDLTNSNSSFGVFGLYADGVSSTEYTGVVTSTSIAEQDSFLLADVKDTSNNFRKPFDGQAAFFKVDLDDFADSPATGTMTQPFQLVRSIKVLDGGSGYIQSAPPNIIVDIPQGPEGIRAELSANVSAAGTITSVDVIASGRNFLPNSGSGPTQAIGLTTSLSSGTPAILEVVTDPIYFTVDTATEPSAVVGLSTLSLNEFVPYSIAKGTDIEFRRISRIITSSHSFEYVGAGTDINRANPFQGGEPIPENEIVAINGGQVPFTSTDQKGNFRIGEGLTIDQTTSTISGRDFNRAIQAQLTPLILALK